MAETDAFSTYYNTPLGRVSRLLIARRLQRIFGDAGKTGTAYRSLGAFGYTRPYLRLVEGRGGLRPVGFHFTGMDVTRWPRRQPSRTALVDENNLPLLDSSLDEALLIHGLETARDPSRLLGECWRVLKGQGRFVVVVPHRGTIWAVREMTPFGYGQPYSTHQIRSLLRSHDFEVEHIYQALAAPPSHSPLYPRFAPIVEKLSKPMGGVLIVEATKMLYSVRGVPARRQRFVRPALIGINTNVLPRDHDWHAGKGKNG
ncbi:class I SAM-dependent methyltransferase [Alphaproteobacteria bacterium LSUCC0684]